MLKMTSVNKDAEIINIDKAEDRSKVISHIVEVLSKGGIVALPTDTVYGLCCSLDNESGRQKISEIKKQPSNKPFQTLIGTTSEAEDICGEIASVARKLMRSYWPGALTIIIPDKNGNTAGLRLPADQDVRAVIRELKSPMSATSANIHNSEPLNSCREIEAAFGKDIDLIIEADSKIYSKSSTVVNLGSDGKVSVLREGDISEEELLDTAKETFLFHSEESSVRPLLAAVVFNHMLGSQYKSINSILTVPELEIKNNRVPSAALSAFTEMGYTVHLPEFKTSTATDIDKADYIFTFSEKAFSNLKLSAPWREEDIIHIPLDEEEFPAPSEKGFSIGPGYREDIIKLERKIWKICKKLLKKQEQ